MSVVTVAVQSASASARESCRPMENLLPFNTPDYIASPYAHWERLRDEAPIYWCEDGNFWAVTRYDDVIEVLHDPARFSSGGGPGGTGEESGLPRLPLIQDDPPHHDRLRRILSKAFTPRITAEREERLREIADELVEQVRSRVRSGEGADLVRMFTSPFPVNVIAEILGIPPEKHDQLRMWNATT
ncbi:MAG: cytochrome P450, partial [Gemmatimonadales bacterium]